MAKVKCEYCGHYVDDTLETCENCGAVNSNHQRTASDTPKTIEELKSWYRARNLPPEETTRFFIGKDIKEPRAFGIFQNDNEFVVYKNKSNGVRVIRYRGTDEAYAVNELYLRLKEEILNQKSTNIQRRASANHNKSQTYSSSNSSYNRSNVLPHKFSKNIRLIIILIFILTTVVPTTFSSIVSSFIDFSSEFHQVKNVYCLTDNNEIYYQTNENNFDDYELWQFDQGLSEWVFCGQKTSLSEELLDSIKKSKTFNTVDELIIEFNSAIDIPDITKQKSFIDTGHKKTPKTAYYEYNNELYYFLDDVNASYGWNNTGWYVFRNGSWSYLCDVHDKNGLSEDLWYYDYEHQIDTPTFDNNSAELNQWNATRFEDTEWYASYERNNYAYQEDLRNQEYDNNNDWDSDSDFDWDSDDSWDSGDSDWDSDW
jgi:hypothetical protein